MKSETNSFAIVSMVLGIMALILFLAIINVPLAIASFVFAIMTFARNQKGKIMALIGMITSGISIVLMVYCYGALVSSESLIRISNNPAAIEDYLDYFLEEEGLSLDMDSDNAQFDDIYEQLEFEMNSLEKTL